MSYNYLFVGNKQWVVFLAQRTENCSSESAFLAHGHIWDGATPSSPDSANEDPSHLPFRKRKQTWLAGN